MSFICEPHSEMWAVDTGCPYCRERKLEVENAKLKAEAEEHKREWDILEGACTFWKDTALELGYQE